MILLEGKKRFYFIPYEKEDQIKYWLEQGPIFTSPESISEGRVYGLQVVDLDEGDLLYFPSHWYHEVHNLTPNNKAITNSFPWPELK